MDAKLFRHVIMTLPTKADLDRAGIQVNAKNRAEVFELRSPDEPYHKLPFLPGRPAVSAIENNHILKHVRVIDDFGEDAFDSALIDGFPGATLVRRQWCKSRPASDPLTAPTTVEHLNFETSKHTDMLSGAMIYIPHEVDRYTIYLEFNPARPPINVQLLSTADEPPEVIEVVLKPDREGGQMKLHFLTNAQCLLECVHIMARSGSKVVVVGTEQFTPEQFNMEGHSTVLDLFKHIIAEAHKHGPKRTNKNVLASVSFQTLAEWRASHQEDAADKLITEPLPEYQPVEDNTFGHGTSSGGDEFEPVDIDERDIYEDEDGNYYYIGHIRREYEGGHSDSDYYDDD